MENNSGSARVSFLPKEERKGIVNGAEMIAFLKRS